MRAREAEHVLTGRMASENYSRRPANGEQRRADPSPIFAARKNTVATW